MLGAYLFLLWQGKTTEVRSFHWTNINEIIFVTNQGVEFYQVSKAVCSLAGIYKTYGVHSSQDLYYNVECGGWQKQSEVTWFAT